MRRASVMILILAFIVSSTPVQAGPILESARRIAAETRLAASTTAQVGNCEQAVLARGQAAAENGGVGGYLAGGIFLPVIMPLIADAGSNPSPPIIQLQGMESADAQCYSAAYGERLKERKVGAAWTGTWIGVGAFVGLIVLAAAATPGY